LKGKLWGRLGLLMLLSSFVWADEIHLKEGKVLSGRITHESSDEYTIRLGKGMVLRVPKENAAKVIRTEPVAPVAVSTHSSYLTRPRAATPALSVTTSTSTPVVSVSTMSSNQPAEIFKTTERTLHGFHITEIRQPEGPLKTKTLYSTWVVSWSGQSGKDETQFKWDSGVVVATITLRAITPVEKERQEIYKNALSEFVETLHQLRSNSPEELQKDSDVLFAEMKAKTERRLQGHLRRSTSHPSSKIKK
jgi:hypothetical protein